jgi:hypothetical protein
MPTFVALKDRVADYLIDVPTKTSSLLGAWINRAQKVAEDRHNFRHMEGEVAAVTVQDQRFLVARPDGWKGIREAPYHLREDGTSKEMAWVPEGTLARRLFSPEGDLSDGAPRYLQDTKEGLLVWPFPDGNSDYLDREYRIRVPFWGYTDHLAADTDENWWTEEAEWYLTFYAAGEGLLFNRDREEATIMFERANGEYQRLVSLDKSTRRNQPRQLVPRVGVYGVAAKPPLR